MFVAAGTSPCLPARLESAALSMPLQALQGAGRLVPAFATHLPRAISCPDRPADIDAGAAGVGGHDPARVPEAAMAAVCHAGTAP